MAVGMVRLVGDICNDHDLEISGESDSYWLHTMLDKHDLRTFLI